MIPSLTLLEDLRGRKPWWLTSGHSWFLDHFHNQALDMLASMIPSSLDSIIDLILKVLMYVDLTFLTNLSLVDVT